MDKIIVIGRKKDQYTNIFVDLPHGLGDQIMCLPLLKSLKNKFPHAKVTVFTPNTASKQLLPLFSHVDENISIDIKFTYVGLLTFFAKNYFSLRRYIAANRFDLYIAPHYNPIREIFARLFPFQTAILNKEHAHKLKGVENVLQYLGIEVDYSYCINKVQDSHVLLKYGLTGKKYIVLDRYPQYLERDPRSWYYFDDLISILKNERFEVVLVGLNENHVDKNGVIDLVNKTSFPELLGVLRGAKLVVALDSGIFHLSYCLDTPVIGLFGPIDPTDRMPKFKAGVYAIYKNISCSPCIINRVDIKCCNRAFPYECMKTISPTEVKNMILEVINHDT